MDVARILRRIRRDPLRRIFSTPSPRVRFGASDDISLYSEAYFFWYRSAERLLTEMSLVRRWRNGPYFARKYRVPYTQNEKLLVRRYRTIKDFYELDFCAFLMFSRILLDRTVRLSRRFLHGENLPSDTSFNRHRKFFLDARNVPYGRHERYAAYIREKTEWFENFLRFPRDKYIVHAEVGIKGIYGLEDFGASEVKLYLMPPEADLSSALRVSAVQLIDTTSSFLRFFAAYASHVRRRRKH